MDALNKFIENSKKMFIFLAKIETIGEKLNEKKKGGAIIALSNINMEQINSLIQMLSATLRTKETNYNIEEIERKINNRIVGFLSIFQKKSKKGGYVYDPKKHGKHSHNKHPHQQQNKPQQQQQQNKPQQQQQIKVQQNNNVANDEYFEKIHSKSKSKSNSAKMTEEIKDIIIQTVEQEQKNSQKTKEEIKEDNKKTIENIKENIKENTETIKEIIREVKTEAIQNNSNPAVQVIKTNKYGVAFVSNEDIKDDIRLMKDIRNNSQKITQKIANEYLENAKHNADFVNIDIQKMKTETIEKIYKDKVLQNVKKTEEPIKDNNFLLAMDNYLQGFFKSFANDYLKSKSPTTLDVVCIVLLSFGLSVSFQEIVFPLLYGLGLNYVNSNVVPNIFNSVAIPSIMSLDVVSKPVNVVMNLPVVSSVFNFISTTWVGFAIKNASSGILPFALSFSGFGFFANLNIYGKAFAYQNYGDYLINKSLEVASKDEKKSFISNIADNARKINEFERDKLEKEINDNPYAYELFSGLTDKNIEGFQKTITWILQQVVNGYFLYGNTRIISVITCCKYLSYRILVLIKIIQNFFYPEKSKKRSLSFSFSVGGRRIIQKSLLKKSKKLKKF
jgi:hypothetical protein